MRTIKFRAKRIDGVWVIGGGIWTFRKETALFGEDEHGHPVVHIIDPETVGEFIGLLDKNSKEIYEGSIFENQSGRGIIEWWPEHCCFGARKVGTDQMFIITSQGNTFATEIIGNIHDNPELLKDETHE